MGKVTPAMVKPFTSAICGRVEPPIPLTVRPNGAGPRRSPSSAAVPGVSEL